VEPPDASEKRIRFGCGFLFGFLGAVGTGLVYSFSKGYYIVGCCVVAGLVCGYAAMRMGDRFWNALANYWWWPW